MREIGAQHVFPSTTVGMRRRFLHLLNHPAVIVATSSNIMIKVTNKTVAINNTRSFAKKKTFSVMQEKTQFF